MDQWATSVSAHATGHAHVKDHFTAKAKSQKCPNKMPSLATLAITRTPFLAHELLTHLALGYYL
mgnify:CR=1 FL=1